MSESAQDILSRTGSDTPNISDFVGQTLTLAEVVFQTGQHGKYVDVSAINAEGDEVTFRTGAKAVVGKLESITEHGLLPVEVKVSSYPSKFGKPGYDIRPVDEA